MVERASEHIVSKSVAGGKSATFRVVEDHAGGRLFLWLEPAMNPDDIVAFYRITEQGVAPIESWQNFQEGDVTALAHSCGDSALNSLGQHPDSPTNRHYVHFVKQYLGDERLLSGILEKYPFCSR